LLIGNLPNIFVISSTIVHSPLPLLPTHIPSPSQGVPSLKKTNKLHKDAQIITNICAALSTIANPKWLANGSLITETALNNLPECTDMKTIKTEAPQSM
jgi:hypothetical protein